MLPFARPPTLCSYVHAHKTEQTSNCISMHANNPWRSLFVGHLEVLFVEEMAHTCMLRLILFPSGFWQIWNQCNTKHVHVTRVKYARPPMEQNGVIIPWVQNLLFLDILLAHKPPDNKQGSVFKNKINKIKNSCKRVGIFFPIIRKISWVFNRIFFQVFGRKKKYFFWIKEHRH